VEVSQKFPEFLAKIKIGILCTYVKKKKAIDLQTCYTVFRHAKAFAEANSDVKIKVITQSRLSLNNKTIETFWILPRYQLKNLT